MIVVTSLEFRDNHKTDQEVKERFVQQFMKYKITLTELALEGIL